MLTEEILLAYVVPYWVTTFNVQADCSGATVLVLIDGPSGFSGENGRWRQRWIIPDSIVHRT
jgi:hypothetical protein